MSIKNKQQAIDNWYNIIVTIFTNGVYQFFWNYYEKV